MKHLRVGTRESALALLQTNLVIEALRRRHPEIQVEIVRIRTLGDRERDLPLSKLGDKGLFIKEIERALLDARVDVAVHSLKDLPSVLTEGLSLGAIAEREDPRDVVVSRLGLKLADLPAGPRVGTSSLRRAAQLRHFRSDFAIVNLRGNVDTRLRKARTEEYDAIVLAAAGIDRLGLSETIVERLPPEVCLPAVGQGALAIEVRDDDPATRRLVAEINHRPTEIAVRAERAFLAAVEGGCQVPAAALATLDDSRLRIDGMLATPDAAQLVRSAVEGHLDQPEEAGQALAAGLLAMGGKDILERCRALAS